MKRREPYVQRNIKFPAGTNEYWNARMKEDDVVAARARFRWKNRVTAIKLLGGKCMLCGIEDVSKLTIDHPNGDGRRMRALHGPAQRLYYRIRRKEFDTLSLRILCYSCNCGLGHVGYESGEAMRTLYTRDA